MAEYKDPMVRWMTVSEAVKRRGGKAVSREVVLCELARLYYDGIVPIGLRCGCNEQGLNDVTRLELEEPADPSDGILSDMLAKELIRIDKFEPEEPLPHTIHVQFCCVLLGRPELEAVWPADNTSEDGIGKRVPPGPKPYWRVGACRWLLRVSLGKERRHGFDLENSNFSALAPGCWHYLNKQGLIDKKGTPTEETLRHFISETMREVKK